jgi:hypothetical protein
MFRDRVNPSCAVRDTMFELAGPILIGVLVVLGVGCAAQEPHASSAPASQRAARGSTSGPATQAAAKRIVLPGIVVDQRAREVQIDGEVCIEQGILEYLAVADDGKTYESLFQLHCRPSQLNAALLMAGYVTGEVPRALRGDFSSEATTTAPARPAGAPVLVPPPKRYWDRTTRATGVTIHVDVRQPDGTWRRRSIESFLADRGNNHPPAPLTWAFTGSFFAQDPATNREVFVADVELSVIALWYDPTALLNLLRDVGNPYRGESNGLEVNRTGLPPVGTPVRLILRRADANGS